MDRQIISWPDRAQVVERDPQELTKKVVAELIDLVQKAENREEDNNDSKSTYWVYREPFPGVRYYSYE